MKTSRVSLVWLVGVLALAGCSTTASRIARNEAAFSRCSPAEQATIRAGDVAIGFTPEMVEMALGKPDRVYRRQTEKGGSESWAYADKSPAFSFGIGIGGGGRHSGGGVAVGTSTGGDRGERLRVHFADGKVVAVDRFER